MRIPNATYRIQFNRDFGFEDARKIVPFLAAMGATHLYASPIFQARAGSTHGYDVTDPTRLNPELGTREQFDALSAELKQYGLGLVIDIVPNHMAASSENPWWTDILENGTGSSYALYFDIGWEPVQAGAPERLLLPILGSPYGTVLEKGELKVVFETAGLFVDYYAAHLPLDPSSYTSVLRQGYQEWRNAQGDNEAGREFDALLEEFERLPPSTAMTWETINRRHRDKNLLKERLWTLATRLPAVREHIEQAIAAMNGNVGNPASFDALDRLLSGQAYHLAYWKVAREKINYRRFFDVTELVGVAVEEMSVFRATHTLITELVREGMVDGLRVDHIDGLYNPREYVYRLQAHFEPEEGGSTERIHVPVWVEKILLGDEKLEVQWPVCGTTGYDFLGALNAVFIQPEGWAQFGTLYSRFTGRIESLEDVMYRKKRQVADTLFQREFLALGMHLETLAESDRHARDLSPRELGQALLEVTASLPVYRTYVDVPHVRDRDRMCIETAVTEARRRTPELSGEVFDFLRRVLLLHYPAHFSPQEMQTWLRFVMRWQQITGPVMAKGVEDTTYYVHNRFLSLNEVGGNPTDLTLEQFHRFQQVRGQTWPLTMNATSTHDTKRSEDVRARINVLSELAEDYTRRVQRWSRWNRSIRGIVDPNDEFMLYQSMIGAWPLDVEEMASFRERMKAFAIKAVREGKENSSWYAPKPEYEDALTKFIDALLEPGPENRFLPNFVEFQERTAFYGAINSLAQVLLKIAAPGFPDFYQGTALWDLSLVDPDNRRPVDYPQQAAAIEAARTTADPAQLLTSWQDGRVKAFVTQRALAARAEFRAVFEHGDYVALKAAGARADHVIAFARRHAGKWAIAAAPRWFASLSALQKFPLGRRSWRDTVLVLPQGAPDRWGNALTGERLQGPLECSEVFATFPVALLVE